MNNQFHPRPELDDLIRRALKVNHGPVKTRNLFDYVIYMSAPTTNPIGPHYDHLDWFKWTYLDFCKYISIHWQACNQISDKGIFKNGNELG